MIALPLFAGAGDKNAAIIDDPAYESPQRLVTIGAGQRLNIYCTGRGSPTIVFESDPSHEDLVNGAWAIDPESRKTYAPYMETLHRCLDAKPEDLVAGSELVKTCGPFQDSHYSAAINDIEIDRGKGRGRLQARISEQENVWFTSADQVRAAYRPLGAIPIIVLTHEPSPRGPTQTQEQRDAKNTLWITLHDQIAAMSTRGKRITVEKSGHYIQLEQPQVVIGSILEVLQDSRRR